MDTTECCCWSLPPCISCVFTLQVYLPIFQTAGSVDLAVNMIQDSVGLFESEEDPARRGQHEAVLRRKIKDDVTVGTDS